MPVVIPETAPQAITLVGWTPPPHSGRGQHSTGHGAAGHPATVELAVAGMHCGACVALIEEFLADQAGVARASVDLDVGACIVDYDPSLVDLDAAAWRPSPRPGTRRRRSARTAADAHGPSESPDLSEQDEPTVTTAELELGGMHCSACATRIQRSLGRLPAVASASVNLATTRAFVSYDPGPPDHRGALRRRGRHRLHAPPRSTPPADRQDEDPDHWGTPGGHLVAAGHCSPWWWRWPRPRRRPPDGPCWCSPSLVEIAGGWPFLRDSARLLRHGATSMDTLIALGTLAALAVSAVEAIALGGRHLHLGGSGAFAARLHGVMAPLIVAILVTGRAVEARARARASQAMHSLLSLRPPTARVVTDLDDEGVLVSPESVPVGALVRVRAGRGHPPRRDGGCGMVAGRRVDAHRRTAPGRSRARAAR